MRKINVEIHFNEQDPGRIAFLVESDDGSSLAAQDILDAVSDALLQYYDDWSMGPDHPFDA